MGSFYPRLPLPPLSPPLPLLLPVRQAQQRALMAFRPYLLSPGRPLDGDVGSAYTMALRSRVAQGAARHRKQQRQLQTDRSRGGTPVMAEFVHKSEEAEWREQMALESELHTVEPPPDAYQLELEEMLRTEEEELEQMLRDLELGGGAQTAAPPAPHAS